MNNEEYIYNIALTEVPGIGPVWARNLIKAAGTAKDVFERRKELPVLMNGLSSRIVESLDCPQAIERAKKEYEFIQKKSIRCLTINDNAYPSRLRECDDAPTVLYYRGNADLNTLRIINMVGTRNATEYGKRICDKFLSEMGEICPDLLVVSGLAYGIDICAHRAALKNNLATVGVLAHGLDRIYPQEHRKTAVEMLSNGGLLTEFLTGTKPDRYNFVSRNRIVAGMCDATIVVESAAKGGSLITADLANGYNRDCFAFPGKITDELSSGCNRLIQENKAALIQSAEDFVKMMGWNETQEKKPQTPQRLLFPDLSESEQQIIELLQDYKEMQINQLAVKTDTPVYKLTSLLFELEMKGLIKAMAGGMYILQ